jgi:hypothetical protein
MSGATHGKKQITLNGFGRATEEAYYSSKHEAFEQPF